MKTFIVIELSTGAKWAVPVSVVAANRAAHFAHEFKGDENLSLETDTLPLFEDDPSEILDWAQNNMDWADVSNRSTQVQSPQEPEAPEYQKAWVQGEHELMTTQEIEEKFEIPLAGRE